MTKRLSESDRRAVDLLLDRTTAGEGFVAHAQLTTEPGLQGVQHVLSLLGRMPAGEPSADLLARTMARIDAGGMLAPVHTPSAVLMTERPHA